MSDTRFTIKRHLEGWIIFDAKALTQVGGIYDFRSLAAFDADKLNAEPEAEPEAGPEAKPKELMEGDDDGTD